MTGQVFGIAPGVDFPKALVAGLMARYGTDPAALARVKLYVNTRRMARRIQDIFDAGPATLLPRIALVTDIGGAGEGAVQTMERRLQLARLIRQLLEREPDLAPAASVFDLADSLTALFDEMAGEGRGPADLAAIDVSDASGHWRRSLAFLDIAAQFAEPPVGEALQRRRIAQQLARWQAAPPADPVIIAGSTGSRGATALLMEGVARLPKGMLVLPGFDFDMPDSIWAGFADRPTQDHPQFRFWALMQALGMAPGDVGAWTSDPPPAPARNRVTSLALRPAPVTDSWRRDGPALGDLGAACAGLSLIEAPSPRLEALAIALRLRAAVEEGQRAALITPNRMLTRQVTAALDRWSILPDDSAGRPLHLSAPGRFLRQIAAALGQPVDAQTLIALLKHPLAHSGAGRGDHLRLTRELELRLRRSGPPDITAGYLRSWAQTGDLGEAGPGWADWLGALLDEMRVLRAGALPALVTAHTTLAERLAAGAGGAGAGALWLEAAGESALAAIDVLRRSAGAAGPVTLSEYTALIYSLLSAKDVRAAVEPRSDVMIWGTLEARVQGADLVILGGLNEGGWPQAPEPDPWLSRTMRQQAGLLLPERRIGLSAHDFQQAVAAPRAVLSRAIRDDEAETVPSRWVNRLTNLLDGLPGQSGDAALAAMKARGGTWVAMAQALDGATRDAALAPRPSPKPPAAAHPRQLAVTRIKTLIRDPYAVYAREVLRLRPLDPLRPKPDAPLRGTLIHAILHRFVSQTRDAPEAVTADTLMAVTDQVLATDCPWPTARRLWRARVARIADWYIAWDRAQRDTATPRHLEVRGRMTLPLIDFTLLGTADRMDVGPGGGLTVLDYKTGTPPSASAQAHFDKQLLLEALMAEAGGFQTPDQTPIAPAPVHEVGFVGLGGSPSYARTALGPGDLAQLRDGLTRLIAAFRDGSQGYTARRAMFRETDVSDYDHLARFGEWDASTPATVVEIAP